MANKTDGLDPHDQAVVDFYSLGLGKKFTLSPPAWSRRIVGLLEHVSFCRGWMMAPRKRWMKTRNTGRSSSRLKWREEAPEDDFDRKSLPIKLAIVGRPNVGEVHTRNRILLGEGAWWYTTCRAPLATAFIISRWNARRRCNAD